MSAPACLFFFGVRFEEAHAEPHPLVEAAKAAGLGFAWEKSYLFIGRRLALIGAEADPSARYSDEELARLAEDTRLKLKQADIPGEPVFWLRWQP